MPKVNPHDKINSHHRSIAVDYMGDVNAGTVIGRLFGIYDLKRRQIGASAELFTIRTRAIISGSRDDERTRSYYALPAGTYYCYKPHTLRDGKPFGAIKPTQWFTTEEDRTHAVNTYFRDAAKRALKPYSHGGYASSR